MHLDYTDEDLVDLGRQALKVEIDGLRAQLPRLGTDFARACRICLGCRGRIVVTGMGKSGHIAGKIAAAVQAAAHNLGVGGNCHSHQGCDRGAREKMIGLHGRLLSRPRPIRDLH